MNTLADYRRALVTAKDALRTATTDVETAKTIAQMHTNGSNDRDRKKADDQALLDDKGYNEALERLSARRYEVEYIETEIDILKDERTARELTCRERNNDVLERYAAALERLSALAPAATAIHAAIPL